MGKMKRNLMILAVLAVVAAIFYPTVKKHYKTYFKPHVELTQSAVGGFLRMQVAGYYPYKFILPLLAVFIVVKIIKKRREKKRLEEERKRLEALGGEDAQHQLISLKNRLDTTERTMHLVMKQMEAISKCLAKTVADDPSLVEGPHMAEISETLKSMKA